MQNREQGVKGMYRGEPVHAFLFYAQPRAEEGCR